MELSNERKEMNYKFDLDVTPEEEEYLVEIGLRKIQGDRPALIEYAVVKLLEEYIAETEKKIAEATAEKKPKKGKKKDADPD